MPGNQGKPGKIGGIWIKKLGKQCFLKNILYDFQKGNQKMMRKMVLRYKLFLYVTGTIKSAQDWRHC